MDSGRVLWLLFRRTWLKTLRRPVPLTFSFIQPLIWMAFFGFLFQRFTDSAALGGLDYPSFVAPGVSLMTVLFGASQAGVPLIHDKLRGYLQRMLYSASAPGLILGGKLAADASRLLLQALIVLGLASMLGAQLRPQASALPFALAGALALIVFLCSVSCLVALMAREPELMGTYVHLVNMPLLFTSTALVPQRRMPAWLADVAHYNPLSIVVEHWRALWLSTEAPASASLWIPVLLGAVAFMLASRAAAKVLVQP